MHADTHPSTLMLVPPPLLFVVTFLAGAGLQHALPITVRSAMIVRVDHALGTALLAVGLLLALGCLVMFLRGRTTIVPHRGASRLVTSGPYRFTRNPMYLSLVVTYLGVAVLTGMFWPLVLLPLPVLAMDRLVIPYEEKSLRAGFGEVCEEYFARVRRWL